MVNDKKRESLLLAKAMYEQGISVHEISRETKLHRRTIARYCSIEKWEVSTNAPGNAPRGALSAPLFAPDLGAAKEQATSNVVDFLTRKSIDKIESSGSLDDLTSNLNDVLLAQPRLAAKAARLAEKILDKAIANAESDAMKVEPGFKSDWGVFLGGLIGGAERSIEMVRTVAGLKAGQPSEPRDKTKTLQRRFIVATPAEIKPPEQQEAKEAS